MKRPLTQTEFDALTAKVSRLSPSNPFRSRLSDSLAAMGGQYAQPGTHNDPRLLREEPAMELAREAAELRHANVSPF